MSRYHPDIDPEPVYKAAGIWRDRCFVKEGSLFRKGRDLWTQKLIEETQPLIENYDTGGGSFMGKLKNQLRGASPECMQLISEVLWIVTLFQSGKDIGIEKKRAKILEVWSWSGEDLNSDHSLLQKNVFGGLGSAGRGFNSKIYRENIFLLRAVSIFREKSAYDRQNLFSDPWIFSGWLNGVSDQDSPQLRNILSHLLFPDFFERIAAASTKLIILEHLGGISKTDCNKLDLLSSDKKLWDLRKKLEKKYKLIDFFEDRFKTQWNLKVKKGESSSKIKTVDKSKKNKSISSGWILNWSLPNRNESDVSIWPCGSANMQKGDKLFFVRTDRSPKGVVALGTVIQAPFDEPNWDPARVKADDKSRFVSVKLEGVCAGANKEGLVSLSELEDEASDQNWSPQSTVAKLTNESMGRILQIWDKRNVEKQVNFCLNLILCGPPGTGKTHTLIRDHLPDYVDTDGKRYEFVAFHQSYAYEDFVEGIRPTVDEGVVNYKVLPGVLKRICTRARKEPNKRFALLIDEINRGNIAKIFGELITLVERDRRIRCNASGEQTGGCTGSKVTLPYSQDYFGVPINVDIIGTMNTSDRSIALLDAALRRRFQFEEMMPEPSLLKSIPDGQGGEIDLASLLKVINLRIAHLRTRDQAIGHSYFFKVRDFDDLKQVFANEILPLLQEVFYNDWERIRFVLADQAVGEKFQLVRIRDRKVEVLFPEAVSSEIRDGIAFEMVRKDEITPGAIRKIYETGASE